MEVLHLHATAQDGTRLLCRHAAPLVDTGRPAIFLLHGFAQRSATMDWEPRSLLRFLASHGFHTFAGELRGRDATSNSHAFSHHVDQDVPALLALVRAKTARPIIFVGHSMGGLIGASLEHPEALGVAGMVLMAPPLLFLDWVRALRHPGRALAWELPITLPTRLVGPLLAAAGPLLDARWMPNAMPVWARGSMPPEELKRALVETFAHESSRVLANLLELGATHGEQAGSVPVGKRLAQLRVPLSVVAGNQDGLAPARTVRPVFERAGSRDKSWTLLGNLGPGQGVGHLDMVVGPAAPGLAWQCILGFAGKF